MTIRQAYEDLLNRIQNNITNAQKIENKQAEQAARDDFDRVSNRLKAIPESMAKSELTDKEIAFIYQQQALCHGVAARTNSVNTDKRGDER